jgi:hypothetical protein
MDNKTLLLGYKTEAKIRSEGGKKIHHSRCKQIAKP